MKVVNSIAIASGAFLLASSFLAEAADTFNYEEYAVDMTWAYQNPDKWNEPVVNARTNIKEGGRFTVASKYPPYYIFHYTNDKVYIEHPLYVYHQGYSSTQTTTCPLGQWNDQYVDYNNGPAFVKKYPKEAWTVCQVAADGGLGGGGRSYLFFANLKKNSGGGGGGDDICKTQQCLRGNWQGAGWATYPNIPPCWIKESKGYYSCFDYVNGKCPWPNMIQCGGH